MLQNMNMRNEEFYEDLVIVIFSTELLTKNLENNFFSIIQQIT